MAANHWSTDTWGDEPTVNLPAYRVLPMGNCGPLIHVTPKGHHLVDWDCEGQCLTCNHPLESQQ